MLIRETRLIVRGTGWVWIYSNSLYYTFNFSGKQTNGKNPTSIKKFQRKKKRHNQRHNLWKHQVGIQAYRRFVKMKCKHKR